MENKYILVINPGSTSTKIAIFIDDKCKISESLSHSAEEIKKYDKIYDQKNMREEVILNWLKKHEIELSSLCAVVGRGGLLRPMPGGTYKVTKSMLEDLKVGYQGEHASNLGGIISYEIAEKVGIPSYIVDPIAVDEYEEVARISGIPEIPRVSLVHALNINAVVRRTSREMGIDFNKSSFVVAHIGGGISVSPVKNGKILDANNANEEGPFSPERTGTLPVGDLVKLAFSGKYDYKELKRRITREGGMVAYLGTNDGREVTRRIKSGDKNAEKVFKAMAYQIAKEIGAMATVLKGNIDAIILTGGLAYNSYIVNWIEEMVAFIAPVRIVPGEDEMLALAEGAYRVLKGIEKAKVYEEELNLK